MVAKKKKTKEKSMSLVEGEAVEKREDEEEQRNDGAHYSGREPKDDLNEGADTDPIFNNEDAPKDGTGLDVDVPEHPKTAIPAPSPANLFQDAQRDHDRKTKEKEVDTLVGLLIGPKNLVKLRAFGFDVVTAAPSIPGSAHMGLAT